MDQMPALCLSASPKKRKAAIEMAVEAESRGFSGIYCPSFGDSLGLCLAIALATNELSVGTSIQPIYFQHPLQLANQAAFIHEVSSGRFTLGIGVSHDIVIDRMNVAKTTPLADIKQYISQLRNASAQVGELPPIVLATLRQKMLDLATENADGAVWANALCSAISTQVSTIATSSAGDDFFVGNMIPTVIDDDRAAAAKVCKKALTMYVQLPNYRNYWSDNGYHEEMSAIQDALEAGNRDALPELMTDRWLSDVCLFGSATSVRDGLSKWFDNGVKTPILVPSSTTGGLAKGVSEIFQAFS